MAILQLRGRDAESTPYSLSQNKPGDLNLDKAASARDLGGMLGAEVPCSLVCLSNRMDNDLERNFAFSVLVTIKSIILFLFIFLHRVIFFIEISFSYTEKQKTFIN